MNKISKIAVVGGTGKAGQYIVKELLNRGYQLKLLLRSPEKFQLESASIEIVPGNVINPEVVASLVQGCDAVISAIGQAGNEESIFSESTGNIAAAMTASGIQRYILLTGLNVDTPVDQKSEKVKMATEWMRANFPATTQDKQLEYEWLVQSGLKWTLVRLPMIALTDDRLGAKVSLVDCPGEGISTTDLASFVVDQLTDERFIEQAPFISN
jgi:putative NADH-flavin reductase